MCNVTTYQKEKLSDVMEEMKSLLQVNYEETGIYNDKINLEVMWDQYLKLDELDIIHLVIARKEGEMIGYYACFIQPHLHYASELFSANDTMFILPEYRKGFTGIKLIKEAEKQMRERGVSVMSIHFKTYAPFDKILERLGWDYSERLYTKYLGDT